MDKLLILRHRKKELENKIKNFDSKNEDVKILLDYVNELAHIEGEIKSCERERERILCEKLGIGWW